MWHAELFNASDWADIVQKSGAKYYVITTKHHEGLTLFDSPYSWNWNSVQIGPHRNFVKELSEAMRSKNIIFGTY